MKTLNKPAYLKVKQSVVSFDLRRPLYEPNNGATSWYAEIPLGTPPQEPLRFMIDTGTANTWITSALCTTSACAPHRKFNPRTSNSYQQTGPKKDISFGTWGTMTVLPSLDFITLNGLPQSMPIQFYISTSYNGQQFQELICDGGIGIPANVPEGNHSTEILNVLKEEGLIEYAIASFYYDRATRTGQALFGAIDRTKFDPNTVNILPINDNFANDKECWLVNLESMSGVFGNGSKETMMTDVVFALDTGSSRFKGGHKFINAAKATITNNGQYPESIKSPDQISDYPYPDLELVFNNRPYIIPPEKYFIQVSENEWELAFAFMEDMEDEFLVGTTFLESVYSIFDYDNRCIILAEPLT